VALKPCRECKEPVSTEAKACPKCGATDPTRVPAAKASAIGCLFVLIGVAAFIVVAIIHETNPQQTADDAKMRDIEDRASAARMGVPVDAYQWGAKGASVAHILCKDAVIDTSRYGGRSDWLSKYGFSVDAKRTTIHIVGTDIELKNGFGAEQYVKYECLVSVKSGHAGDENAVNDVTAWADPIVTSVTPLHE
jgi:hypothetical protein